DHADRRARGRRAYRRDGRFARVQRRAGGRFGRTSARHPRARSRYGGGRRRPAGPVLPRPADGGTVLPAGEPAPRRARRPDTGYGGGRGAPARLHPCVVVNAALSGAGLLPEAGLGGRRPDRVRAARPHAVLHDEESGLKVAAKPAAPWGRTTLVDEGLRAFTPPASRSRGPSSPKIRFAPDSPVEG